ncbi:MAG: hypothetical protein JXA37_10755 [Chloroflexia bacterium]|nr:hypothetical protein [Chloroflexia bacterium]
MARKRGLKKQEVEQGGDMLRQVVHGVLSLVLGALATWLARKLTDMILGPAEPEQEAQASD